MDHLRQIFGGAETHSVGMRYSFDDQGNQVGQTKIAGMGADLEMEQTQDINNTPNPLGLG